MSVNVDNLIKITIENSIIKGENTEKGDYKKVNKAYDKIVKTIKELKKVDPECRQLIQLLKHDNDSVKLTAAYYLLPYSKKIAEKILKKISKKNGLIAFGAKMTLQEWEKGNLKFD
jgi:hypothetical protein